MAKQDKILVIDDEEIIFNSINLNLSKDNYQLYYAPNGKEGLKLFEKEFPLLVILDLRMPVMDGFQFLANIDLTPSSLCAVIVHTGYSNDEDIAKCFNMGVTAFLPKPYNVYELKGMVKNYIHMKKTQRQLTLQKERHNLNLLTIEDGVISLNTKGDIIAINRAARILTGYSFKQAIGQKFFQVFNAITEKGEPLPGLLLQQIQESGQLTKFPSGTLLTDKNGKHRVVDGLAAPIYIRTNIIDGIEIVFRQHA